MTRRFQLVTLLIVSACTGCRARTPVPDRQGPAAAVEEKKSPGSAEEEKSPGSAPDARDDESSVRDLVRKYIQKQAQDPAAEQDALPGDLRKAIALEYTVLLQKGEQEEAVDPHAHEFQLGDRIRVQIEPMSDLFIYIFHEGASGTRICLLPDTKQGEKPPLAQRDKILRLPNDGGYIEFAPPAGDERLIVVATETEVEVKVLEALAFKRPDEELSPEEKALQEKLKGRAQKTLKSIREQAAGQTFRGIFSDELLNEMGEKLKEEGGTRAVLEEPPHGQQKSTFTMSVARDKEGASELFVSIPLKSGAAREQ